MKRRLRVYKKTVSIVNETAIGMYESLVGNKKGLSSREWKDLKNHGQIGYSYEYKNTGKLYDDYTDGKIIIKIKYYNKELKKNVEIWINPWEGIESREKILLKD